ncbi:eyes absent homolog [Nymphaea colorata]|nr:eyes absent homolog [Nymphaea colorata]
MAQISLEEGMHGQLADASYDKGQCSAPCHGLHGKRHSAVKSNSSVNEKRTIYIWDMDETLILLQSLLNGTYGGAFNGSKDIKRGFELGKCWATHILHVCDSFFFYEQIGDFSEPYLHCLSEYDDGRDLSCYDFTKDGLSHSYDDSNNRKLAYRYRVMAKRYAQGLDDLLDERTIKLWHDLYSSTDHYTDGWLSSARSLLACCRGNSPEDGAKNIDEAGRCIHVLVTSGALVPSLVKCLLFRLNDFIPSTNVYSSCDVGKLQCFSWIRDRFNNSNSQFCVIGNGLEECEAAEAMNWPFVEVDMQPTGNHRFPGLSIRTIKLHIEVAYGVPKSENDESSGSVSTHVM